MSIFKSALGYSEEYQNYRMTSIIHALGVHYTFLFDPLPGIANMISRLHL